MFSRGVRGKFSKSWMRCEEPGQDPYPGRGGRTERARHGHGVRRNCGEVAVDRARIDAERLICAEANLAARQVLRWSRASSAIVIMWLSKRASSAF